MHHPAKVCIRQFRNSIHIDSSRHGYVDMVLYPQGWNQDISLDGYVPNFMYVFCLNPDYLLYHKCLDFTPMEAYHAICDSKYSQIFVFDDWISRQNFWKQFLSGIFVVIVMTGLDQDMMQKNLTCKTLRDAQKDMCTYGFAFVPANLLF